MDISRVGRKGSNGAYIPAASSKSGEKSFSQSFGQQMNDQQRQEYRERVETLFGEIRKDAQNLLRKKNLAQFEAYRQRISVLLGEILQHGYLFESEKIRDGRGHERIYATVSVVDDKMESLGNDLLKENSEQLDLISRMDEIRGLIMDLFS